MRLLEKFLACKPTGAAKRNKFVIVALQPIVTESFNIFYDMTEVIATLIDRFMQLEVLDMVQVHRIFFQVSQQYDELDTFYYWCKSNRIMGASKYPVVEKIPKAKLDTMYDFIHEKSKLLRSNKTGAEPDDERVIKALSPVNVYIERPDNTNEVSKEMIKTQEVGDLLDLSEDSPCDNQDPGNKMALVLYDGNPPAATTTTPTSMITVPQWEAFSDSSTTQWETFDNNTPSNWEKTSLNNHKASFNPFMLDGTAPTTPSALPAPLPGNVGLPYNADPFAASLAIVPQTTTHMPDKNQRFLLDQQPHWIQPPAQQYPRDGMGMGMARWTGLGNGQQLQHQQYPYRQRVAGGYTQAW
ncbi:putative clathrin assembly protein At1g03050 [Andrographis paniculata]|uniref:putative clathrin assembly protein At1g03050 n=1 Tax=Andrographis paniculata TaxID=175694 RepID=UPI0021E87547|nr:putative clathrin assembly protein At1g03050 [Andrographis paniculata]